MTTFNPDRHEIVARDVVTKDIVNVSWPDLIREVREDAASYDDAALKARIAQLESQVADLASTLSDAAASYANLLDICRRLDSRIDGVSVNLKQVAA